MENKISERTRDINRFYYLLDNLRIKEHGPRRLSQCDGKLHWPYRGVYFFFEEGESRAGSSIPRVVRIGTHAVSEGSKTTLWSRLRTHRGHKSGSGNHRGSVFRKLVGYALLEKNSYPQSIRETWGIGNSAAREIRTEETPLEKDVSNYIGRMPFLWIKIDDMPGPDSKRKYIERNVIALLSARTGCPDISSDNWLGKKCKDQKVRSSGLWNSDHVDEMYDSSFLDIFEQFIVAHPSD